MKSVVTSSTISVAASTGGDFAAYLALPERPVAPAIVILQEIFGVNANIRGVAYSFAAAGYIAIAPDLFWRQQPNVELDPAQPEDRERATGFLKGIDTALAVADALTAAAYVRTMPRASGKIGAVGYCLGGKLAYLLATHAEIDAAVSYYGVTIQTALDQVPNLKAKLLLHIAGDDHLCPPDAQAEIHRAMAAQAARVTIIDYPGAGHAFARQGGASLNAAAAARADRATLEFLALELGGKRK
jgi:carboxymethylenebutenolidase